MSSERLWDKVLREPRKLAFAEGRLRRYDVVFDAARLLNCDPADVVLDQFPPRSRLVAVIPDKTNRIFISLVEHQSFERNPEALSMYQCIDPYRWLEDWLLR